MIAACVVFVSIVFHLIWVQLVRRRADRWIAPVAAGAMSIVQVGWLADTLWSFGIDFPVEFELAAIAWHVLILPLTLVVALCGALLRRIDRRRAMMGAAMSPR